MQKRLRCLLSLGAVALWLACIVACRAAWSPDGSKILFPFYLPDGKGVAIALHDVKAGTTRTLRAFERAKDEDQDRDKPAGALALRWMADGKRALALRFDKGATRLDVFTLDCEKGDILKRYPLVPAAESGHAEELNLLLPPALIRDRHVLITEKNALVRLDLETGEVKRVEIHDGELTISVDRTGAHYFREKDSDARYEFGTLDPETLERSPLLSFSSREHGKVVLPPAADGTGRRVAFVSEIEERPHVLVFRGEKLELKKAIASPVASGQLKLLDTVWAPGGDRLLVSYGIQGAAVEAGIVDIPLSDDGPRFLPLRKLEGSRKPDVLFLSLSPDGRTLAALATLIPEPVDDRDRPLLFLVDLATRKVTEVRAPRSGAASEKQGTPGPRKKEG